MMGIMERMHNMGVRSEHFYMLGLVSVAVAAASWMGSRPLENKDRGGNWGIFIGEWAPTFVGMGNALRTYEK